MNDQIAIIEESDQSFAEKFGFIKITYLQDITGQKIDEWVRHIFFKHPTIEKIIIPVRLGKDDSDYTGLRVGLHIRLTKGLKEKQLIPIIFISEQTKSEVIGNQIENNKEKTGAILFTPGTKLVSSFDIPSAAENFNKTISEQELKSQVLPKLLITNQREQGHQLANEWGVFRLAKFAGVELTSIKLPTDLFFKYQFSRTGQDIQPHGNRSIGLQKKGCNALLIDDYANEGWREVLEHILKSHINLHSSKLEVLTTFETADTFKGYESKDLVFLDLRLKPEEDRASEMLPLEDLSGLKLLHKIKGINKGIQVIVLTASNKAWNMKALLDAGADGYFIKESPEVPVSDDASKANYESLVRAIKEAFERRYLRDVFREIKALQKNLDALNSSNIYSSGFLGEIKSQLDVAFDMHYHAKSKDQFAFAYITLYMIIETINNELINHTGEKENKEWFAGSEKLKNWEWDKTNQKYQVNADLEYVTGNKPPEWKKMAGLYFQKWAGTDHHFVVDLYRQITKRNGFVHNDKVILDHQDRSGKYVNHDIYIPEGFWKLFDSIKTILDYL